MARADEYRGYAAECIRVAQQTADPNERARLLAFAQKWRELARKCQAEKGKSEL